MRYKIAKCKIGDKTFTYPVCASSLLTNTDIAEYIVTCGTHDFFASQGDDYVPDEETYVEPVLGDDVDEWLFLGAISTDNVRERFRVAVLGDPNDTIITAYRVFKEAPTGTTYVRADAACGQEGSVSCVAAVDGGDVQAAYGKLRDDLLYQLKRYHEIEGLNIHTGVVSYDVMSEDEYNDYIEEHQAILA